MVVVSVAEVAVVHLRAVDLAALEVVVLAAVDPAEAGRVDKIEFISLCIGSGR